jgi:hypothetical protein
MRYTHTGDQPVYAPNSYGGPAADPSKFAEPMFELDGEMILGRVFQYWRNVDAVLGAEVERKTRETIADAEAKGVMVAQDDKVVPEQEDSEAPSQPVWLRSSVAGSTSRTDP